MTLRARNFTTCPQKLPCAGNVPLAGRCLEGKNFLPLCESICLTPRSFGVLSSKGGLHRDRPGLVKRSCCTLIEFIVAVTLVRECLLLLRHLPRASLCMRPPLPPPFWPHVLAVIKPEVKWTFVEILPSHSPPADHSVFNGKVSFFSKQTFPTTRLVYRIYTFLKMYS